MDSDKYPRTLHLPFSPGICCDDKVMKSVEGFLERDLTITEKVDGGNACLTSKGVYARTHGDIASHPSFNHLKATWATIKNDIPEGWSIFGENVYAKHSIFYDALPSHFMVFGVRMDLDGDWLSWVDVEAVAKSLNLCTIPRLWRGEVEDEKALRAVVKRLIDGGSRCGGEAIEGLVIRDSNHFFNFENSVGKWVRAGHVQTDEHWTNQPIVVNRLKVYDA